MALAQLRNVPPHESYRAGSHHIPFLSGPRLNLNFSSPAIQHFTSSSTHLSAHSNSRTWSINTLPPSRTFPATSTGGADAKVPLQPKPQVKRPRLPTLPTFSSDPPKPRRWHKTTSTPAPLPTENPSPSQLQPQPQHALPEDSSLQSSCHPTHHAPAPVPFPDSPLPTAGPTDMVQRGAQGNSKIPNAGRGSSSSRANGRGGDRDRGSRQLSSEFEPQSTLTGSDGKPRNQQSQPKAQSQSQSWPAAAGRVTQGGRGAAAVPGYESLAAYGNVGGEEEDEDEADEADDDEDEDELLIGLSEDEVERMVFAQARGEQRAGSSDSGGGIANKDSDTALSASNNRQQQQQLQQLNGSSAKSGAAHTASPSIAEIVATAGLPTALSTQILAAVQSGAISNDPDHLATQLKALREGAADVVGTVGVTNAVETATDGHNGRNDGDVLSATVGALSALLNCGAEAAIAILVNYPRYVKLAPEEAEARLRFVSYQLALDLVGAQEAVRQNPVLLLVPSDALRRKLTALANATGLKMTQAADMVTLYMFPGL